MNRLVGGAARDAWTRWRGDREVILAIAGVFVFLPVFGYLLLAAEPPRLDGLTQEERVRIALSYFSDQLPWLVVRTAVQLFGTAALLTLYLDRRGATVADVLRRSVAVLPWLAIAVISAWGLTTLGLFAFVIPGLYVYGRTALAGPVLIAERGVGFAGAIARSIALTHGNGWRMFSLMILPFLLGFLAVQVIGSIDQAMRAAGAINPVAKVILDALAASVATIAFVARVLLEVSLYRRLASPRHGI